MKKRLIVCADGTWQDLDCPYPTNVVKMAQAIQPQDPHSGMAQIVYYEEGLGTKEIGQRGSLIDTFLKLGGGGLGLGIDHKIQDIYRFLCLNYQPEDEIYLFGFSRGSYTVRCVAGLIYNVGLLPRQHLRKIPEAYELYREKQDPENRPSGRKAIQFRETYHAPQVPIHALCCWDTVASLGFPDLIPDLPLNDSLNERYRFYDSTINPTIQHAFHAVAVDEIRKSFDVTLMKQHQDRSDQVVQVWFPGDHGSVGGGSAATRGLSDAALQWMMEQVEPLGLALDPSEVEDGIQPDYNTPFNNTPKGIFKLTGTHTRTVPEETTFDELHGSVKHRWNSDRLAPPYRPENLERFSSDFATLATS